MSLERSLRSPKNMAVIKKCILKVLPWLFSEIYPIFDIYRSLDRSRSNVVSDYLNMFRMSRWIY
jgi:hypothetical protein